MGQRSDCLLPDWGGPVLWIMGIAYDHSGCKLRPIIGKTKITHWEGKKFFKYVEISKLYVKRYQIGYYGKKRNELHS